MVVNNYKETTIKAVSISLSQGFNRSDTAKRLGLHRVTVQNICKILQKRAI